MKQYIKKKKSQKRRDEDENDEDKDDDNDSDDDNGNGEDDDHHHHEQVDELQPHMEKENGDVEAELNEVGVRQPFGPLYVTPKGVHAYEQHEKEHVEPEVNQVGVRQPPSRTLVTLQNEKVDEQRYENEEDTKLVDNLVSVQQQLLGHYAQKSPTFT